MDFALESTITAQIQNINLEIKRIDLEAEKLMEKLTLLDRTVERYNSNSTASIAVQHLENAISLVDNEFKQNRNQMWELQVKRFNLISQIPNTSLKLILLGEE